MEYILEVKDLVKIYKGKKQNVLANDRINLALKAGECIGILGPNGSGKTTFVQQVISFLPKTSGEIKVFGQVYSNNDISMSKYIGYMMQHRFSHWDHLPVETALRCAGILKKMPMPEIKREIEYLFDHFQVAEYRKTLLRRLSGGNKQAVCLGIALMGIPKLIILDEPSVGLDPIKRKQFWNILNEIGREYGSAMIIVSHNPEEIERVASRVAIFDKGRIIEEGSITEIKKRLSDDVRIEIDIENLERSPEILKFLNSLAIIREKSKVIFYLEKNSLPSIMKQLVGMDLWSFCDDFKVISPTLEDVYIKTIGKKME